MNFIKNLVSRHTESTPEIQPRLSNRFELSAEPPTAQPANPMLDNPTFLNPQDTVKLDLPIDSRNSARDKKADDVQSNVFNQTPRSNEVFPLRQPPNQEKNKPSFSDQSDNKSTLKEHENKVQPIFSLEKHEPVLNDSKIGRNRKSDDATPTINHKKEKVVDVQARTLNAQEEESSPRPTVKPKEFPTSVVSPLVNTVTPVLDAGIKRGESNRQMNPYQNYSKRPQNSTPPTPTIKVTIGRIEVRATMEQAKPAVIKRAAPKPNLSLKDYLKKQ